MSVKEGFHLLLLLFILIYLLCNPYTSAPYAPLSARYTEYIEKLNAFAMLFLWLSEIDWFCCDSNCNWKYLLTISLPSSTTYPTAPPPPSTQPMPTSSSVGTCLPASGIPSCTHFLLRIACNPASSQSLKRFLFLSYLAMRQSVSAVQRCAGRARGWFSEEVCLWFYRYNSRKAFWQCAPRFSMYFLRLGYFCIPCNLLPVTMGYVGVRARRAEYRCRG